MEPRLLSVLLAMGISVIIFLLLIGFLALLFSIFAQVSGWNALTKRYGTVVEPQGRKLTRQTVKVGIVRWRYFVTIVLSSQGMYLKLGSALPIISAMQRHPPVLIPWSEFKAPRKGRLYLGWQAVQLSIGDPEITAITFPLDLYKEMTAYSERLATVGGL